MIYKQCFFPDNKFFRQAIQIASFGILKTLVCCWNIKDRGMCYSSNTVLYCWWEQLRLATN